MKLKYLNLMNQKRVFKLLNYFYQTSNKLHANI